MSIAGSSQYEALLHHAPPALLVIFRIGGLMIYGPVFGSPMIPGRVKVFLAFLLGLAAYPLIAAGRADQPALSLHVLTLGPMIAMELAVGLVVGYIASLPLIGAQTGGLLMGQQMGLGFARFFDPAIDDESDIVGQVLFYLALAGFLVIGGHEAMLISVLHSFDHIPLGGYTPDADLLGLISGMMLAAFELALRIAAPLLALIFLESVAMGFIAKTVPQMNILSLGFPIRIIVGLLIVAMGLVVIDEVMMEQIDESLHLIVEWAHR